MPKRSCSGVPALGATEIDSSKSDARTNKVRSTSTNNVNSTLAVIGSMVRTVPANCVPVNYGSIVYQQCGSTWYQPQGGQYVAINPPY
jgi:hypothetical protein